MKLNANQLLEMVIAEIKYLKQGEEFLVKDLFKGYQWNRIARNERLLLGRLFLNYVTNSRVNLVAIEKTSSGQQRYRLN